MYKLYGVFDVILYTSVQVRSVLSGWCFYFIYNDAFTMNVHLISNTSTRCVFIADN